MEGTRIRKIADWAVIALFVGTTWIPLAALLLPNPFNRASNDLRELASFPKIRLKRSVLSAFPPDFEAYWNDHFGFRGLLIHGLNVAKVRWLHVPTSANVLLGQASWLFYTPRPAGTDYNGVRPFTTNELNRWQRVLEHRRDWLERRGCRYLLFIPPDKQTIYPEYLDPTFRPRHAQSRLDQLLTHLRNHHSKVEVLDIRQPLLVAKEHERLYHKTDSHWNDRGAFVGYQQLSSVLSKWFPVIQPTPRSAFQEATTEGRGGDLATMVDLADRNHEEWLNLIPRLPRRSQPAKEGVVWPAKTSFPFCEPFAMECDDPRLPRAVMFHDSFCLALCPFLSEHFRRIAYVWHDDFHQDVVQREQPEVVIQQLLERKLGFVTPNDID